MWIDLTTPLSAALIEAEQQTGKVPPAGHIGTHFDVMDRAFPLDYLRLDGVVFDVSAVSGRDIDVSDVALDKITCGMFVAFYTGFIERHGYGTPTYVKEHPQLSEALIDALLAKGTAIIGVDFAGIRRGKEHVPADARCAEKGCFVVEHLCALSHLLGQDGRFTAYTFPLRIEGLSGLPCRVVAETTA